MASKVEHLYDPMSPSERKDFGRRNKKIEHFNETHHHSNKTGFLERNKAAKTRALKKYTAKDFRRDNPVAKDYEGRKNTHKFLD